MTTTPRTRTRPAHLIAGALAALTLLGVASAPASAYGTRYATFDATISGTYVNDGTLTSTGCFRFDDEAGERVELGPMTGTHSERTSFRSTRPMRIEVSKADGEKRIVAGGKAGPVRVRTERRSELATPVDVRGCTPQGDRFDTRCGEGTTRTRIGIFGTSDRIGLSWFVSGRFSAIFPADPFESCPFGEGSSWWGLYRTRGNGVGDVSVAKLFSNGTKRIVVKGSVTRSADDARPAENWSAQSQETMRWTLVLERRGKVRDRRI